MKSKCTEADNTVPGTVEFDLFMNGYINERLSNFNKRIIRYRERYIR